MARKVTAAAIAFAALLSCRPRALTPEGRAVLARWLAEECGTGEGSALREQVRKHAAELEQPLIDAFEKGPPPERVERAAVAARERLEYARRAIEAGKYGGLDPKRIKPIQPEDITRSLARVREDTVDGYRSAALAGLALVDGSKGRRLLERLADDPQSPYRDLARSVLGRDASR